MRDIIINKTEREGLLYLLFQDLKYKFGKFLNLNNFILRKKRISNFLNQNDKINIQFGAGSGKFGEAKKTVLGTFLNTDIFGKIPVDINYSLPFPNNSIDLIFSSHLIEHIYQRKADLFFKESLKLLLRAFLIEFSIDLILLSASITLFPLRRPACLSPILITGKPKEGASVRPLDEFPIITSEEFITEI